MRNSKKRGSSVHASYDLYNGKCSELDEKSITLQLFICFFEHAFNNKELEG